MTLKILAVGDLHLGHRPTRLPDDLAPRSGDFSPAAAWRRTVDLAIRERVAAVLLAGDVAESSHDYFEALPRLQTGIADLASAGIQTFAVSGNHDVNVLPRLLERVPGARLLGRDGQWESVRLTDPSGDSHDSATLWGWSFPTERVTTSPLAQLPSDRGTGPLLGLLHCDRDQARSPYAPVTSDELRGARFDAWLLGHIHQPDPLTAKQPTGYLGTVVGLDAGDPGPRGPWLIEIAGGSIQRFDQRTIAPMRWERIDVDLSDATRGEEVIQRLSDRLARLATRLGDDRDQPDLVALRLRLTGECDLTERDIRAAMPETDRSLGLPGASSIQWFIESWHIDTRPVTPLTRLAERDDQPGLLARRLLILQRDADDPDRRLLLEAATQHLESAAARSRWEQLPGSPPDTEIVAEWLRESGQNALRAMLAQERG